MPHICHLYAHKIGGFDVGLLNAMADLPVKIILDGDALFQEFRGSLTESFVAQEMAPLCLAGRLLSLLGE